MFLLKSKLKLINILMLAIVSFPLSCFAKIAWQQLDIGLAYTELASPSVNPWGKIHVFRLDPSRYQFDLAFAHQHGAETLHVNELAKEHHALLAVNGGFFTPDFQPIGLRIKEGKIIHRIQPTSWWGVFYLQNNTPYIRSPQQFEYNKNIQLAIQGGPRLIIEGAIPPLKPGIAERTALGITQDQKIIILATENAPLTTEELARIMQKSEKSNGLNCRNALNLDGGKSTQMYADINNLQLNIEGYSAVTDAFIVKR